jgi:hypothetical protein
VFAGISASADSGRALIALALAAPSPRSHALFLESSCVRVERVPPPPATTAHFTRLHCSYRTDYKATHRGFSKELAKLA